MRTLIIFTLCLFTVFSGKCESSALVKNIANDIIGQLEELMQYNAENSKKGNGKDNKYILNYIPGKSFAIENCDPSYIIDKIPNANLNESWNTLSDQLCEYNNNNIFNIKHYGIAIWYPDNTMDTELYELMAAFTSIDDNTNIVTYTKSQQDAAYRRAFKEIYAEIEAHVKQNIDIPGIENNGELLVTMMSIFSIRDHKKNHSYDARTKTFYAASPYMELNFALYLHHTKTATFDVDGLDLDFYYGDFYRRLYGFIDYFSGSNNLPSGTSCSEFTNFILPQTIAFVDSKCRPDLSESEIGFLYITAGFLDKYLGFGPPADYTSDVEMWASSIFNTYDLLSPQVAWKDFLFDRIISENNSSYYFDTQLYLSASTFVDHNQLSASNRFALLEKLTDFPTDVYLQSTGFHLELIDIVAEFLLTSVEADYFDALQFYTLIKSDTKVFKFLWDDILNTTLGTADKKMNVIKSLTRLSKLAFTPPSSEEGLQSFFAGKTYVWKLNPWWDNLDDHHDYFDAGYDATISSDFPVGKSYFKHKYLVGFESEYVSTGNGGGVTISQEVFNTDQLQIYDPFAMTLVKSGSDFKWNTHCSSLLSNGDCVFSPRIVPAFALAWYISNVQSDITMDMYTDIIAAASVAISMGTFLVATSVSGILVTGMVLCLDVISVTAPPLQSYTEFALFPGDINANQINESVQATQALSNQIGLAAGVLDIGFMLKGLCSYRRLNRLGAVTNVNAYDKAFEGMRIMSLVDETDVIKIADELGFGSTARTFLATTDATQETKLMLIGLIENKPFLKNVTSEKVFILLREAMENINVDKHIFSLTNSQLVKFLDEFADSSGDVSKIVENPALISAWRIADDVVPNRPRCFAF